MFAVPTWYVAFAWYGVADCVIRHTHVCPEVSDRSIKEHITSPISQFRDLLQRIVFVLQGPAEVRLLWICDSRAKHVILAIDSFLLYVAFRFNYMENTVKQRKECKKRDP